MIGNLLPFLMFGIFLAAVLTRPLSRQKLVSLPAALVFLGFVSSEIWVGLGQDTGLRWQILRDLVFYLLLPILIFEAAININIRHLRREGFLIGTMAVPLLLAAAAIALALSLNTDIPFWYTIQSAVYGVALFSMVVQTPLVARLTIKRENSRQQAQSSAGSSTAQTLSSKTV